MGLVAVRNFILFLILAVCLAGPAAAQRRVSARAQVQTVMDGKVTTVTKEVYCSANGRLVTVFHSPELAYIISNPKGEVQIYRPSAKEVISEVKEDFSDRDDLLYLFLTGRVDDMGLAGYGYKLVSSKQEEGGIIRKAYRCDEPGRIPRVELVTENFLPIYLAYIDGGGKVVSKTWFTQYLKLPRFFLPARVTNVSYTTSRDSVITRTTYSDVKVDPDSPLFDFQVPADARLVPLNKRK
ncbi:MAG: hypothetical protein II533_04040 [Bacteroidales bacterium]|nr:hypothetical protein [Bacteroidales bacterium]